MSRPTVIAILAALIGTIVLPELGRAGAPPPQKPAWRDILNCGPNCLYLMLSLAGKNPSYGAVCDAVEVGRYGSTMAELKRAAARFGLRGSVVRCDVNELAAHAPAIIHMDLMDGGDGHFVLLLGRERDMFYVVETSNAEVVPLPKKVFLKGWTGAAFVANEGPGLGAPLLAGGLGLGAVALLVGRRRMAAMTTWARRPRGAA